MSFKKSVLVVALIVVVSLMILIATILNTKTNDIRADSCPDYWSFMNTDLKEVSACNSTEFGCCPDRITTKTDADGTNCPIKCYNSHQLGTVSSTCTSVPAEVDFGTDTYTGSDGVCNKQKWAKQCNITWDGVTNIASAC
jgi:hypothetical protein